MEFALRKYFWIINLFTIAVCAVFAAQAVGHLAEAAIPAGKVRPVPPPPPNLSAALTGPTSRDITGVLTRNVFCSECEPEVETPLANTGEGEATATGNPDDAPVKTSLNIKLIATLVSPRDSAWSFAAITNLNSSDGNNTGGKTGMFAIGGKIEGATVTDIMERRVLLLNNGRNEYLSLLEEVAKTETAARIRPTRPRAGGLRMPRSMHGLEEVAKGIRKMGAGKYEIRRAALNKVLGNTMLLARSARIVPSVRNGKPNGFKLYAIRPGSLYSLLGMFNGDTISAINGHAITTPDKALEVYTKLRNASHLSIAFNRRGKNIQHEYNIR